MGLPERGNAQELDLEICYVTRVSNVNVCPKGVIAAGLGGPAPAWDDPGASTVIGAAGNKGPAHPNATLTLLSTLGPAAPSRSHSLGELRPPPSTASEKSRRSGHGLEKGWALPHVLSGQQVPLLPSIPPPPLSCSSLSCAGSWLPFITAFLDRSLVAHPPPRTRTGLSAVLHE